MPNTISIPPKLSTNDVALATAAHAKAALAKAALVTAENQLASIVGIMVPNVGANAPSPQAIAEAASNRQY
ncbi:hypothetical protein L1987_48897 [Smallanthus sonchifolius]|uniref:Uncharacterized protein n=1 Tax=Smallanthus sonchifolius TaxID=185202 RepID=A0ACB9FT93_9ASTR|nr:hypothetical protein L1987_48897 [Smallanthus sonchifolius]